MLILFSLEATVPADALTYPQSVRQALVERAHTHAPGVVHGVYRNAVDPLNNSQVADHDEGDDGVNGGDGVESNVVCHPFGVCEPCPKDVVRFFPFFLVL